MPEMNVEEGFNGCVELPRRSSVSESDFGKLKKGIVGNRARSHTTTATAQRRSPQFYPKIRLSPNTFQSLLTQAVNSNGAPLICGAGAADPAYAGAEFENKAPSPSSLPLPPTHWYDELCTPTMCEEMSSHLKLLLRVQSS